MKVYSLMGGIRSNYEDYQRILSELKYQGRIPQDETILNIFDYYSEKSLRKSSLKNN